MALQEKMDSHLVVTFLSRGSCFLVGSNVLSLVCLQVEFKDKLKIVVNYLFVVCSEYVVAVKCENCLRRAIIYLFESN